MSNRAVCPKCGSMSALGDYHCFKCSYTPHNYQYNPLYVGEAIKEKEILTIRDDLILKPQQFPPKALEWLYKSCIYDNIIIKQKIGYCTDINRVFIPAFDIFNTIHFYQLRSLDHSLGNTIRYITKGRSSDYLIHYQDHNQSNTVIICEDHLSAIRLRQHDNVVALSGTSLSHTNCRDLAQMYSRFIFWLDPDEPGRQAFYKNLKRLKWHCNKEEITSLYTSNNRKKYRFFRVDYDKITEDPKSILDSRIKNILNKELIQCE
jgi:hypothetical protein